MRHLFALICLALPISGFALSCPNNASIIEKGDSLQEVIQHCGQPAAQRTYLPTISTTEQRETYYGVNENQINKDTYSISRTSPQEVVKITYNGSRLSQNNTMVFVNDTLVHWY